MRSKGVSGDKTSDLKNNTRFLKQLKEIRLSARLHCAFETNKSIKESLLIDKAITKFHNLKKYTSLRSIHEMDESAYKTAEILNNSLVSSFNRNKNMDLINDPRKLIP